LSNLAASIELGVGTLWKEEAKRICDDVTSRKGGDEINDNGLKEEEE
jgi:hypothetical protein